MSVEVHYSKVCLRLVSFKNINLLKIADVKAPEKLTKDHVHIVRHCNKRKKSKKHFRWTSDMVEDLIKSFLE